MTLGTSQIIISEMKIENVVSEETALVVILLADDSAISNANAISEVASDVFTLRDTVPGSPIMMARAIWITVLCGIVNIQQHGRG